MKTFSSFIFCILVSLSAFSQSEIKSLAVQDGGRIKPFDSLAREVLQLVHGKQNYNGRPAYEIVMTWILAPEIWQDKKFLRLDHQGLKAALKIEKEEKFFSPQELLSNPRLELVLRELQELRTNNEKLTPYFQAVQRLENQLITVNGLRQGSMRIAPPLEGDTWVAIAELSSPLKEKFAVLSRSFAVTLGKQSGDAAAIAQSESSTITPLKDAVEDFKSTAQSMRPDVYPKEKDILREIHYNDLHPFQWSWIFYISTALLALVTWITKFKPLYYVAWATAVTGFAFHAYGFFLRVILTGRPPVSNMYESVVWVAFGVVLFTLIFEALRKKADVLMAGSFVATLCMVVADSAPVILDSSLQPLEPVLRSNLWLTVHVLTITLSYAPLFLAFAIGTVGLLFVVKGESENSERVKSLTEATYRCIQIGIVLLAAGTILGGVWADYSWGRFWGWDPKETWAFIALMGYLALLHARLSGMIRNFGMLAGAVIAFNLVIMAWYGVNFVLGAGLHSYGFGAGGIEYVAAFCGSFLIFTVYAFFVRSKQQKAMIR